MNPHPEIDLINAVLQLGFGESRVVREDHLPHCTVHRYRDGWTVYRDLVSPNGGDSNVLGWFFRFPEEIAQFLVGPFPDRVNFVIWGMRP